MPRALDSRFVYPRDVLRDVARTLSDMRARCWCDPQLHILDETIRGLVVEFESHGMSEALLDNFSRQAGYLVDRVWALNPTQRPEGD